MTVSAGAAKAGPYTGNDSASAFTFSFKVFADTDIRVVSTVIATSVETDLVLNTNYTVARNADQDTSPGGTVTYKVGGVTTAYPSTHKLTIVGNFSYEQPTDIPNGGAFFASVVETALDRLTLLIKQIKETVDRAVTVDASDTTDPSVLIDTLVASSAAAAQAAIDAEAARIAAEAAALSVPSADAIQEQTQTKFTTGGTSTAYTGAPSPAITANTAGMLFFGTFHTAPGASPTLAVSGQTALNLKYRDSTGAKRDITATQVPSGWASPLWCDGTDWVVLNIAHKRGSCYLQFTRDMAAASGDVAYTGFGFTPTVLNVTAGLSGVDALSVGAADGLSENCFFTYPGAVWSQAVARLIYILTSGGNAQECFVKSIDADGVTLTWAKSGTPTGTLVFNVTAHV